MRTNCPACGATVQMARKGAIDGDAVPLEMSTDASSDADRYRIIGFDPLRVQQVPKGAVGDYYPDHRADCPGHGNGL